MIALTSGEMRGYSTVQNNLFHYGTNVCFIIFFLKNKERVSAPCFLFREAEKAAV